MSENPIIKSPHFTRELNLISDANITLRETVRKFLDEVVPDYFWCTSASSTGKFHASFSSGDGGLVRHTKAIILFAEEFLRLSSYAYMPQDYKDYAIAACIIHDTFKYGEDHEFNMDSTTLQLKDGASVADMAEEELQKQLKKRKSNAYVQHAPKAAQEFAKFFAKVNASEQAPELLLMAVRAHMGQWSSDKEDRPFTSIDRLVHMADYCGSRSFIDIPQVSNEWSSVEQMAKPAEDSEYIF